MLIQFSIKLNSCPIRSKPRIYRNRNAIKHGWPRHLATVARQLFHSNSGRRKAIVGEEGEGGGLFVGWGRGARGFFVIRGFPAFFSWAWSIVGVVTCKMADGMDATFSFLAKGKEMSLRRSSITAHLLAPHFGVSTRYQCEDSIRHGWLAG